MRSIPVKAFEMNLLMGAGGLCTHLPGLAAAQPVTAAESHRVPQRRGHTATTPHDASPEGLDCLHHERKSTLCPSSVKQETQFTSTIHV